MSENKNNTVSSVIGFSGLLAIVFITLKLLGVIDWSWLWVLSPLWISVILTVVVLAIIFIIILFNSR